MKRNKNRDEINWEGPPVDVLPKWTHYTQRETIHLACVPRPRGKLIMNLNIYNRATAFASCLHVLSF